MSGASGEWGVGVSGDVAAQAVAGPAIEVDGVSREFRTPRRRLLGPPSVVTAVRDVSLRVETGERFALVGESGCGKSTLLRMIAALDRPTRGSIRVEGRRVSGLAERELGGLRRGLQLVLQDPMGSLDPRMRVADIVAEPLVAQGLPGRAERVAEVLTEVGLDATAARRYPHQFSGGQRQRISIARALAPRPRILLADEPVSALDVSVRAQVLNLLHDLVQRHGLTLVLVSHDLAVVRHLAERVAVMRAGEVVETGPTEQVWTDPQHPWTQRLVAAAPDLRRVLDQP